jgi:hypothetical protein
MVPFGLGQQLNRLDQQQQRNSIYVFILPTTTTTTTTTEHIVQKPINVGNTLRLVVVPLPWAIPRPPPHSFSPKRRREGVRRQSNNPASPEVATEPTTAAVREDRKKVINPIDGHHRDQQTNRESHVADPLLSARIVVCRCTTQCSARRSSFPAQSWPSRSSSRGGSYRPHFRRAVLGII